MNWRQCLDLSDSGFAVIWILLISLKKVKIKFGKYTEQLDKRHWIAVYVLDIVHFLGLQHSYITRTFSNLDRFCCGFVTGVCYMLYWIRG